MAHYVHFDAVKQLLRFAEQVETDDLPLEQELSEWLADLEYGAYDDCIALYQTIRDQYANSDDKRKPYPYSAVQRNPGYDDLYQGAPPAIHLIMCQDSAVLSEEPRNFVADDDYPALYSAIKTWDADFIGKAVARDDGWDFAFRLEPPKPEPKPVPKPKPKPKPEPKPEPKQQPKPADPAPGPTSKQAPQPPTPWWKYAVGGAAIFVSVWLFTKGESS